MSLKLAFADGLPFSAPHRELERSAFRAPAYKRVDIGMSYRLLDNSDRQKRTIFKNIWLGVDCLNLFGVSAYKSCQELLSPKSDRIGASKSKIRQSICGF